MLEMCTFPEYVIGVFEENGVKKGDMLVTLRSDMDSGSVPADTFIALTKEYIAVSEGTVTVTGAGSRAFPSLRTHVKLYECRRFEKFALADISEIKVELLIASARIIAVKDGTEIQVYNTSGTYRHDANVLCECVKELKEKGEIDYDKHSKDCADDRMCPKCGRRYPDPERKVCPKCMQKGKLIKKLASLFMHYRMYVLILLFTFTAVSLLSVAVPYVSNQLLYGEVLDEAGAWYGMIGRIILVIIGIRIILLAVNLINGVVSAKIAAEVTYDLKKMIFGSIGRLSLSFFTNRQTGGLMTQVNGDSNTIYWFFCDGFPYLVTNLLSLLCVLVVMLASNPLLTLYAFITVPVFFLIYKYLFLAFDKLWARNWSRRRSLNSLISDVLNGMRVVKSFSREEEENVRFGNRNRAHAETLTESGMLSAKSFPFISFLLQAGLYVVWGVGGWQVMTHTGGMTYASLAAFVAYFSLITGPLQFFADVSNWWSECLNSMQRLFEIKEAVPGVRESEHPVVPENPRGEVKFDHVVFSYEENRTVIDDISFDVPAGTTLGIVGKTGAGKSTLTNLLTRLYDVGSGAVYIDGVNVKDLSFAALRDMVAIVSQETYLFRGTIKENIRYARPDATDEEVMEAARIASAHQFIIKYPDAYDTVVGFGGKELSGGEKQRVSIARAVLKNPKILILDEATAAMDTQTERQIQQSLTRLSKGRTTIMIAHRLSTLRDADRLVVIENGKIPESGTAVELLKAKGAYYRLYKMQAEALKTIGIEE